MSKIPADQGMLGCSRSCYWVPESPCWVPLIAAHSVWLFNNSNPLGNLAHACHSLLWSQLSLWTIIWNPDKALNVAKLIEYSGRKQSKGDDTLQLSHQAPFILRNIDSGVGFNLAFFLQRNLTVVLISPCGLNEASTWMTLSQAPATPPWCSVESMKL